MRTTAVVPSFNNSDTIAETVSVLLADGRVDSVVVVDDGSTDRTGDAAAAAGAQVVTLPRNMGKHAALERGMSEASDSDVYLMVDADTGGTAVAVVDLIAPITDGTADMVIGVLPAAGGRGGFGLVRDFARWCIRATSGFVSAAPMSGQRALRREVFESCRPLSFGFAVDAALTADAVRRGFRVAERPVAMEHHHRGRTVSGFAHRGRQGWHILRTFTPRLLRLR